MMIDIQLIQKSFNAIKPHADEVMAHFYAVLFQKYPDSKVLFKKVDMKKQRQALAGSLAHIIEFYNETDHLNDYLKKMGSRHKKYGVKAEHYSWVADALLETLAYFLDQHWNEKIKAEWTNLYIYISENMQKGLASAASLVEAKNEPTLADLAKSYAKELLKKAIDEELAESYMEIAREKAREALKKALKQEAKELMDNRSPANRAA